MSAVRRFRIAAIPADGVGREVVAAGREVLDALAAGSGGAFAFEDGHGGVEQRPAQGPRDPTRRKRLTRNCTAPVA